MKYIYKAHPSRMATLAITFGAGSRVELGSKYPFGIAHFMEHMRFKGTDNYTAKEMAKKIAFFGGDWNAFTSEDMVNYHIEIPEENIEKGFELLSEIALRPTFPLVEADKEKEVVCQEVRSYDDDMGYIAGRTLYSKVFNNTLAYPVVGTEESVKSITIQNLKDFSKDFYFSAGSLLVVGSQSNYNHWVEKYFGIADDIFVTPPPASKVEYAAPFFNSFVKEGHKQHTILVGFGNEQVRELPKKNRAAVKVFNSIFGGGADARLFMKVREDLGLVYGISSSLQTDLDGALFNIGTSTEPENSEQVLAAIDEVIADMLKNPPAEEELTKAKNMIKSQFYRLNDSSNGVVMNAVNEQIYGYSSLKFLADIENISTKDVMEIATTIFDANKYVVVGKGE